VIEDHGQRCDTAQSVERREVRLRSVTDRLGHAILLPSWDTNSIAAVATQRNIPQFPSCAA
jgi:hypothetical protein